MLAFLLTSVMVLTISMTLFGYSNSKPIYNANGSYNLPACRRVFFRFMVAVDL